ncbi:MAG TPA: AMP-binding protein [Pseudonocardia sp.]|nr:AMP-binding protein [Pseudonocardia sp.]
MPAYRTDRTVNAVFTDAVKNHHDELFLDFSGEQLTYGETDAQVQRVACGLHELGVGPGDHVVTMLDNGPDAVLLWLALNRLGAVNVPVNTSFKGEFLRHQVADAGAALAVVEAGYLDRFDAVSADTEELRHVLVRGDAGTERRRYAVSDLDEHRLDAVALPEVEVGPADRAVLLYTSGTTGPAKGCMLGHNYLCDQGARLSVLGGRTPDELSWTPLPLFHIFGMAILTSTIQLGGAASFAPRFSVSGFWPEIERSGARIVNMLGSMAMLLAQQPDTPESRRCHGQIRAALAVPFPEELKVTWRERFGVRSPGLIMYGQTEAGSAVSCTLDEPVPPGATGRRNETFEAMVVDEQDRELPPGEVGEIVVRPRHPNVMFSGYWNRPEATAEAWRNLWHHTGDLGRFDAEGYFYWVDRKKDYLRRRGENISSFEVEAALTRHPAVSEVAVHAVPSELTEDDVKATAVLVEGAALDPAALIRWAEEHVPAFAVPRYVEFRDELPKNPVGRVLKFQLREQGVTPDTWDREVGR